MDRRYPLQFLSNHANERIHSQFNNMPWLEEGRQGPLVEINHLDAKKRGLSDGDRVRIFNHRGEIFAGAKLSWGMRQGVVNVYEGWWFKDGAPVNKLSNDGVTDMGFGTAFHNCMVEVEIDATHRD